MRHSVNKIRVIGEPLQGNAVVRLKRNGNRGVCQHRDRIRIPSQRPRRPMPSLQHRHRHQPSRVEGQRRLAARATGEAKRGPREVSLDAREMGCCPSKLGLLRILSGQVSFWVEGLRGN